MSSIQRQDPKDDNLNGKWPLWTPRVTNARHEVGATRLLADYQIVRICLRPFLLYNFFTGPGRVRFVQDSHKSVSPWRLLSSGCAWRCIAVRFNANDIYISIWLTLRVTVALSWLSIWAYWESHLIQLSCYRVEEEIVRSMRRTMHYIYITTLNNPLHK